MEDVHSGYLAPAAPQHHRATGLAIAILLIIGLYFPTSINGAISKGLMAGQEVCTCALLLFLWFQPRGRIGHLATVNSLAIPAVLLLATAVSPLGQSAYGALGVYSLLALLFCTSIRTIEYTRPLRRAMMLVDLMNVSLGVGVLIDLTPIKTFLTNNYSVFYPELVPNMLSMSKPVLVFGSHSLAAFYFYLFFWVHFEAFKAAPRVSRLVTAIIYCFFCASVMCATGFIFAAVAVVQMAAELGLHKSLPLKVLFWLIMVGGAYVLATHEEAIQGLRTSVERALLSKVNGYNARYIEGTPIAADVDYIIANPLSPVGLRYSASLWFVDCGPVEYVLRGSIVLLVCIYGGLWGFVKHNVGRGGAGKYLFVVVLAFELAFNNLIYIRTIAFLPCIVVYLNHLHKSVSPVKHPLIAGMGLL
jgi:hypothetical protein